MMYMARGAKLQNLEDPERELLVLVLVERAHIHKQLSITRHLVGVADLHLQTI